MIGYIALSLAIGTLIGLVVVIRIIGLGIDAVESRVSAVESRAWEDALEDIAIAAQLDELQRRMDHVGVPLAPPPVMLRRTREAQKEMQGELQPSEGAAVMARMDAVEEVIKAMEDRLAGIYCHPAQQAIRSAVVGASIEIRRHMAAERSEFETQICRRIVFCEEHITAIEQKQQEADLKVKRKKS